MFALVPKRVVASANNHLPLIWTFCLLCLFVHPLQAGSKKSVEDLWALKPVMRPEVPQGLTQSKNPIDSFIAAEYRSQHLTPVGAADKTALLRRVCLDLAGIPPTPAEVEAFLTDESPDAYEKVVDRLLASEQHAVRYARHWLDVLRYADVDVSMTATPGMYLWRDWVINALNEDIPYDHFVRTQLTGYRTTARTEMVAVGYRHKVEPRPDDLFALGFLARGAVGHEGPDAHELSISAVETVSTAFMGMTVGCAKCHDHMYDPIKQKDFYAMKALFDPLVVRKITLATPAELITAGKIQGELEARRDPIQKKIDELNAPYKKRLFDDRVAMLPAEVREIILKPEKQRTHAEQKIADDYYPILRIDSDKISEVITPEDRAKLKDLEKQLAAVTGGAGAAPRKSGALKSFYTVEVDRIREQEKCYVLTSGEADRPEKNHEVQPGWPFAPAEIDFREGRVETFSDWLTTGENPLFARVAVNRIWQWHFGEGLQKTASDFGELGGRPTNPKLLDWLAAEFVKQGFSMKKLHRLMVTSDTYKLASLGDPAVVAMNSKVDAADTYLWRFRLQRLEAEPIWDSILTAAGTLDLAVGGPSFEVPQSAEGRNPRGASRQARLEGASSKLNRRAAYITRGYSTSRDVMASFLQAFDVDDGRTPCPLRTQTVTAPQSLFMMNSAEVDRASTQFAARLEKESKGDIKASVDLAYSIALARPPSGLERAYALHYLENDPAHLKNLAWLMFNLDEFVYVR